MATVLYGLLCQAEEEENTIYPLSSFSSHSLVAIVGKRSQVSKTGTRSHDIPGEAYILCPYLHSISTDFLALT